MEKLVEEYAKRLEAVTVELPHLKYVIDSLHAQGLCAGALPKIYRGLSWAVRPMEKCEEEPNDPN